MADFAPAFDKMITNEGGYKLINVAGDRGGQTYAGIARKMNPSWAGWPAIDRGDTPETDLVRQFYRDSFWAPIRGDEIADQRTAETMFDFSVNVGSRVAVKLAQVVIDVQPDGVIGPITIGKINAVAPDLFMAQYALAKLSRYRDICVRDRSQVKFLVGWLSRTLRGAA